MTNTMEAEVITGDVPAILDDQLVAVAEQAEKRIEAVKKIKSLALAVTNANDWTDQNKKPYLQVSGAEKVARLFGVNWRIDPPELETHEDGHFTFTYKGFFEFKGATIEAIGSRCSRDGFFSKRYKWDDKKKKSIPYDVPPSEVDRGNVKKGAYTNCIGNGVTRLLGIRNMTWDEVEAFSNFKRGDVTAIQYGKDKGKSKGDDKPQGESYSEKPISEPQRKKLWAMMKENEMSDAEAKVFYESELGENPTLKEASAFISEFDERFAKYTEGQDAATGSPPNA